MSTARRQLKVDTSLDVKTTVSACGGGLILGQKGGRQIFLQWHARKPDDILQELTSPNQGSNSSSHLNGASTDDLALIFLFYEFVLPNDLYNGFSVWFLYIVLIYLWTFLPF